MPSFRTSACALVLLAAPGASAAGLSGSWLTPVGTLALEQKGDGVEGRLDRAAEGCALPRGEAVFKADVLEDSLSGQLLLCLRGCGKVREWVPALLLVAPDGEKLSGALTIPKGCRPAVAAPSAFVAVRAGGEAAAPRRPQPARAAAPASERPRAPRLRPEPDPAARAKAHEIAADGAQYLDEGRFEMARGRFLEAVKVDPTYAEGYNGIGASYRARNDLTDALRYYKRSVQTDPSLGDAYYNMACVYALQGKKRLALRYLGLARRNGYVTSETVARDDDLASLRSEPAFQALLEAR